MTVLLGLALALLGSAASAEVLREEVREEYRLSPGGTVAVSNTNGSLEIESWSGDRVVMEATKEVRALGTAATREALEDLVIEVEQTTDRLTIRTRVPTSSGLLSRLFGRRVEARVSYRLRVPAGISVEARTVNGNIEIAALDASIDASTTNGRIHIANASSNARASTTNGSIRAEFRDRGSVEDVALHTTNGGIIVWLPSEAPFSLDASTVNGAVSSDFELPVHRRHGPGRKHLEAEVNGGGGRLEMRTVNGSIQLRHATGG